MDIPFKHIVSEDDLRDFPSIFENMMVGQEVELTSEQYEEIGLELHILTDEDISAGGEYYGFGFVLGEKVEKPRTKVDEIINQSE